MTFSIVGRDPEERTVGVAIASVFPAVGAVCPYVDDGVALSTQSWDSGRSYGEPILDIVGHDISLPTACEMLLAERAGAEGTQLHGIELEGDPFVYTGKRSMEWAGHAVGTDHTVAGNVLTGEETIETMSQTFEQTDGPLEVQLLEALKTGEDAGGDSRGDNLSAALLVHGPEPKLYRNLRVDEPGEPIKGLWRAYQTARDAQEQNKNIPNEEWGEDPPDSIDRFEIKY